LTYPPSQRITPLGFAVALAVISCFGAALISCLRTKTIAAKLVNHEWVRTYHLQQWQTVREEAWDVPNGARVVSKRTENRSSIKVGDTNIPILDDWYTYEVERWRSAGERSSGGPNTSPVWPDIRDIAVHTPLLLGDRRVSGQEEHYYLVFCEEGLEPGEPFVTYKYELDLQRWLRLRDGQMMVMKVNGFGSVVDAQPLEAD